MAALKVKGTTHPAGKQIEKRRGGRNSPSSIDSTTPLSSCNRTAGQESRSRTVRHSGRGSSDRRRSRRQVRHQAEDGRCRRVGLMRGSRPRKGRKRAGLRKTTARKLIRASVRRVGRDREDRRMSHGRLSPPARVRSAARRRARVSPPAGRRRPQGPGRRFLRRVCRRPRRRCPWRWRCPARRPGSARPGGGRAA